MFQKRKTSPQLLLEFLQPNNNALNNRNENQQKLEKLLKDSFSSQKIEIKRQQLAEQAKESKTRNFLKQKLRTVENATMSPQFKLSKKMVTVSQSKLNVLQSLGPIIQKFNAINDYEINKKEGDTNHSVDTADGGHSAHEIEEN